MNLPKYIPGLTVVVKDESEEIYPEGFGMFVISDAFLEHEEWHYQNYDGKIQIHEHEIVGVINQGYYVAAERFNGVEEAPEHNPDIQKDMEEMLEHSPEEEAFIKEQFEKHQAEKKKKKIEVKDGNEQKSK